MRQCRVFVVICDGNDESQLHTNLYNSNLFNRLGQWKVKMVISCCTQYLGLDYLNRFVPQGGDHYGRPAHELFEESVIAPFSKEQIKNYVDEYIPLEPRPWATKDYMDRLATIPNLLDLVSNPFLLSLALEAMPRVTTSKQEQSTIKITRVQLYDTIVNQWFGVNQRRLERNNSLPREDRDMLNQLIDAGCISQGIGFTIKLAVEIFEKQDGDSFVHYLPLNDTDSRSWKARFFSSQPKSRISANWIRKLTPRPLASVSLGTASPFFRRNLLMEPSIIQFLCDRVKLHSDFKDKLRTIIDQSKTDPTVTIAATNAIIILVKAGVSFQGADLRCVKIPGADLSIGEFDSAHFQGADLSGANLSRSWL
ncbi:hypothetical protein BGZ96_000760 [Linnemannia gamsii]|uniref:Pentapeptide repeat-containing protein n=1 Tax=Linnemannia gamsii TaxID=64522 RepID=A0ABQ7K9P5_9FUNG|nr:hypothetical protein BGZ96_000760 [Linnemannia gamsii]